MANFTFYNFLFFEKSGCGGNARQKEILKKRLLKKKIQNLVTINKKMILMSIFQMCLNNNIFNAFVRLRV